MGRTRKPPERRQRRGTKDAAPVSVAPAETGPGHDDDAGLDVRPAPAPDRGWLAGTTEDWREFWASDIARQTKATDRPAVRRLFRLRDQLTRTQRAATELRREAMKEPIVDGSMAQKVANPLFRAAEAAASEALSLEGRVLPLEDRFGLSPRARLNLGLSEQHGLNLLGRNEALARKLAEVSGGGDPRTVAGDAATDTA